MIDVDAVSYTYGRRSTPVLNDVSFTVEAGSSVGLVGESGSGKTTILRLLLGLARPSAGEIRFRGAALDTRNRAFMRSYRRSVQTVFQDPYSSLDPRQRVRDIVSEPLRSLGIEGDHRAMVEEALASVDLPSDAVRRYSHEFSGGQRQRIAIARAIVSRPDVLLADEPISALDLSTRLRVVEVLRSLARSLTLVLVSHDLSVVASLCSRTIVLKQGRIVEDGNTRQLLKAPDHPYTKELLSSVPSLQAYRTSRSTL